MPSYARPVAPSDEETIHGRIQSFHGKFDLQVRDDRGYIDNVQMHQGTIINPTGISLQPGMSVTIYGHNEGRTFAANEIDTPYHYRQGYAYPVYPVYPVAPVGPYPYWVGPPGLLMAPRFVWR